MRAATIDDTYAVSYAQESFAVTDASAINVPAVVWFADGVEPADLQRMVDALARRHPALRTELTRSDSGLRQWVRPAVDLVIETCHQNEPLRDRLGPLLLAGSEQPFTLFDAPLARAEQHRFIGSGDLVLLWLHHAVSDLASSQVLAEDLRRISRGDDLAELTVQPADWAAQERALTPLPQDWQFWRNRLARADAAIGGGRPAAPLHQAMRPALPTLSAEAVQGLARLAVEQRTTMTTVLAAATVAAHRDGTDASTVLIGLTINNRDRPALRPVVGCLADQLPLVVDVSGRVSFRDLLLRVRESLIDSYDHRLPLGVLRDLLGRNGLPLFDVNLNFVPPARTGNGSVALALPYGITKRRAEPWWLGDAGLAYRPRIDDGALAGEVEGDAHIHGAEQVLLFGHRFVEVLERAAADPDGTLEGRR
jgi:Condensation domain